HRVLHGIERVFLMPQRRECDLECLQLDAGQKLVQRTRASVGRRIRQVHVAVRCHRHAIRRGERSKLGHDWYNARQSEPVDRLKTVLQVLDPIPVFDRSALELLRWAAEYYHHPIGQVLAAALPKALRLGAAVRANEERWIATAQGREALARGDPRRAPKQREL